MSKTSSGLVKWAQDIYNGGNHVYWWGTYGNKCTYELLNGKTAQYPGHYTSTRMATYRKHVQLGKTATDCAGLIKGYYWEENGVIKYRRNGRIDYGSTSMYKASAIKDNIASMPEIPGILVWTKNFGHVGVYVGNGYVIEARGFAYGIQKNKLSSRNFVYWGLAPYITYTEEEKAKAQAAANGTKTPEVKVEETKIKVGNPVMIELNTLKNDARGNQVKTLQRLLNEMGYSCGKVDGIFGSKTLTAVKAFQKAKGLIVDGIVGKNTWNALLK